jgi:hypothetical protein
MATKKTELNKKIQSQSVVGSSTGNDKNNFAKLTREQLSARYNANVAERKRLSGENKLLAQLWKEASPKGKKPVGVKPVAKPTSKKK